MTVLAFLLAAALSLNRVVDVDHSALALKQQCPLGFHVEAQAAGGCARSPVGSARRSLASSVNTARRIGVGIFFESIADIKPADGSFYASFLLTFR